MHQILLAMGDLFSATLHLASTQTTLHFDCLFAPALSDPQLPATEQTMPKEKEKKTGKQVKHCVTSTVC